jgi:hypothetical protein
MARTSRRFRTLFRQGLDTDVDENFRLSISTSPIPLSFDFTIFTTCTGAIVDKSQRVRPAPISPSRPSIDCLFRDADVGIRHMEAVLLDIVQALFDVDAGLGLTSHQIDRFEGGPRSVLGRKVVAIAVERKSEHTAFAPEYMKFHPDL